MLKKYIFLIALFMLFSISISLAETAIQQIQSPIYTDEIGRSHFLGKGGYSSVRHIDMGATQSEIINEVSQTTRKIENETKQIINNVETDITNVIQEKTEIPVSKRSKATFTTTERQMDPSATFGQGAIYLPTSKVNDSKTIYTDEIGRLHFFGKGNLIKE